MKTLDLSVWRNVFLCGPVGVDLLQPMVPGRTGARSLLQLSFVRSPTTTEFSICDYVVIVT